jgi:hypothetical protein
MKPVARAAQDVGIALLLGGNVFGRRAMHPALEWVSSASERGKVTNEAWRRYGLFNSLGLAGIVGGWAVERSGPLGIQDATVAAVAVTGVASAVEGVRFLARRRAVRCRFSRAASRRARRPRERRARSTC